MNIRIQAYEKRKERYDHLRKKQIHIANMIANTRAGIFLGGVGVSVYMYFTRNYILCAGILFITFFLFTWLVIQHRRIQQKIQTTSNYSFINEQSIKRLQGKWTEFVDSGEEFCDLKHPYSHDLDIFGASSLFQMINTAYTWMGRNQLKEFLVNFPDTAQQIKKRQEAIKELSSKIKWRQRLIVEAALLSPKHTDPQSLKQWAEEKQPMYENKSLIWMTFCLPFITIMFVIIYLITLKIPFYIPLMLLLIQYLILRYNKKERINALSTVYQYKESLRVYMHILKHIDKVAFQSEFFQELKEKMQDTGKHTAYQQINRLVKISDTISNRSNSLYFIFNILLLWDYHAMIRLENWKKTSGHLVQDWLEVIGEMEALTSLSGLQYDHSEWAVPTFDEGLPKLYAKELGHPLLSEDKVCNDITIQLPSGILLITGSNMSGKSTLLRTAGVNLVLAYTGAPVCAQCFECSIMSIYSCMRTRDNLDEGISSFYAELLRIRMVIEAINKEDQVFFLLDEIFKGTNSADRHTGARTLIKRLSRQGAIGLVSTHDLELGVLEEETNRRIRNFHFREYYEDDRIAFDYKLRPGISTTRNALYLMKMAGIDV